MNVQEALTKATEELKKEGINSPRLDSEVLLMHVLGWNKTRLYLEYAKELTEQEVERYRQLIEKRTEKKPVAYLVGKKEFMALDFQVDERVLIPRPETELLVEAVLKESSNYPPPIKILDLGTGSGAIALSIAYYNQQARVYALDYSSSALAVAKVNAKNLGVENRVEFLWGDLWQGLPTSETSFSIIVSNPPYISQGEMEKLAKEVVDYEPSLALEAGADGLDFYRRISHGLSTYLAQGGLVALEVGYGQAQEVQKFLIDTEIFSTTKILSDYAGIERIVLAWRKK